MVPFLDLKIFVAHIIPTRRPIAATTIPRTMPKSFLREPKIMTSKIIPLRVGESIIFIHPMISVVSSKNFIRYNISGVVRTNFKTVVTRGEPYVSVPSIRTCTDALISIKGAAF